MSTERRRIERIAEPVDVDLVALRRVAQAATPGPWLAERAPVRAGGNTTSVYVPTANASIFEDRRTQLTDATHIAAFDPPTVLALLDQLEEAEAKVARVEAILGPYDFECARLGLPCFEVLPPDRWCRGCRLTKALSGDLTVSEGDGGPRSHRGDDNAGRAPWGAGGGAVNCLHCGAEVNGLALCQMCRAALLNYLEFLPVYFRNLSRWRPSPSGRRRVPGSREPLAPRETGNDRIGHRIDEAHADITGWLRPLADDRPYFAEQIWGVLALDEEPCMTAACKLLEDNVDSLCTLPWVGDLLHSVQHHEWRLREETERSIPGWYAGACSDCAHPTYVVPGLTWVTCQSCGTVTNAKDHLPVILKEARAGSIALDGWPR